MMVAHNFSFICSYIASKKIENVFTDHQNVITSYERTNTQTQNGYGALLPSQHTRIEYGCRRDENVNYNCHECKHAAKFQTLDILLIFLTLGAWWLIGFIVIPNTPIYGITRGAALSHSTSKYRRDATFTDNNSLYNYEGRSLRVY